MSSPWQSRIGTAITTLLRHLPIGAAWDGFKSRETTANRMMAGYAESYDDMTASLDHMITELDPRTTDEMLPEWETSVSLPDPCLPAGKTLEERRSWIMWRLTKKRWNTLQDWEDLAELFGLSVRITPGWLVQKPALYAAFYPKRYDDFPKLGRFRVYIDILGQNWRGYPYDGTKAGNDQYPIPYGVGAENSGFRCLIERVAPANLLIIWNEFPPISPNGNSVTFSDDFTEDFS